MTAPSSRPSLAAKVVVALERHAHRPGFLPALSIFPLTDYVLPFLPNQLLLLVFAVLMPRRWWLLALTFIAATAVGAFLTAWAVQSWGPALLQALFGGPPEDTAYGQIALLVERYGLWALAALALLPWPPRAGVLVCSLVGLSPLAIAAAVALGRVVPVGAYTLAGAYAPHLLRRVPGAAKLLSDCDTVRAGVSGSRTPGG